MPTAAKLVALLAFAAVGFFTAEIYKTGYEVQSQWGWFSQASALIGALCGWRIAGSEAGLGWYAAINSGLKTVATMLFYAMIAFSIETMLSRATMKYYDGIFDAILGTFDIMLDYGAALFAPQPLITLLGGGMLAALLTEWAKRQSHRPPSPGSR